MTTEKTWEQVTAESVYEDVGTEAQPEVAPKSYSKAGTIIDDGASGDSFPLRISQLQYDGYVQMWDTRTGVMSLTPQYMVAQQRAKRRPDGSAVFTFSDPHIPQDHGEDLFCPLNPKSPEWDSLRSMGFTPCTKAHIPNQDAKNQHLRKSHKRAFAAIEQARVTNEREEMMALQRATLRAQEAMVAALSARNAQDAEADAEKRGPGRPRKET